MGEACPKISARHILSKAIAVIIKVFEIPLFYSFFPPAVLFAGS